MAEIFSLPNVTDRIFSFIAERTCTLFFYFSRSPGYQSDQRSELWPYIPEAEQDGLHHTYLQHVIRAIKSLIVEHMSEIGGIHVTIHNAYGADNRPERLEIRQHTRGLRRFMLVEELISRTYFVRPRDVCYTSFASDDMCRLSLPLDAAFNYTSDQPNGLDRHYDACSNGAAKRDDL